MTEHTSYTMRDIEELALEACEIVASRFESAVRFAEAYGHEGRTIVIDGSMHSPSTRALPRGEQVWQAGDPELWEAFDEITDNAISLMTVPEDTDSDAPDDWTLTWEDGCLFAYAPELPSA